MFGFFKGLYAKLLPANGIEFANGIYYTYGAGSPEGVLTAPVGSVYVNTTDGAIFSKTSGSGNTGWAAVASSFAGFADGTQAAPGAYFTSNPDYGWWYDSNKVIFVAENAPLFAIGAGGQIEAAVQSLIGTDYLALYPGYLCRAWVNFNGTGTVAIRASGNVSSITDNGTGGYTINFGTAFPDANYAVGGMGKNSGGASSQFQFIADNSTARTSSLFRINTTSLAGTPSDSAIVNLEVFR